MTLTWCYLFFKILQNEILKSGRNLPLATFGIERVNGGSASFHFYQPSRKTKRIMDGWCLFVSKEKNTEHSGKFRKLYTVPVVRKVNIQFKFI